MDATEINLGKSVATAKEKKPRSEAQINATKRALEALQAKRKEQWEKKKEELIQTAPDVTATPVVAPAPVPENKPTTKKYNKKQVPIESKPAKEEMPEWAKVMYDKLDKLSSKQKKKKVVIQDSDSESSSDEEIVIRKKKTLPPPPPSTPVPEQKPVNTLRQLLNRR